MKAFIYKILNKVNGKFYIGSTIRALYIRKYEHLSELRKGSHPNSYLQKSFNKYGEESFTLEIVEECVFPESYSKDYILEYITCREFYYVELSKPEYNLRLGLCSYRLGYTHSEETKKKISEANKRKTPKPLKAKRPISGWKHSEKSLLKIKERSNKEDNKLRIKQIQKQASKARIGSHHSKESKIQMSIKKFGKHRQIEIFNLQGDLKFTCDFSPEASALTGVGRNSISNNLAGITKKTRSFIFKYKEV